MIPKIFFTIGCAGVLLGTVAIAKAADASTSTVAAATVIGGIGSALIGLYAVFRKIKREQDTADREARRKDCEEQLVQRDAEISRRDNLLTTMEKEIQSYQRTIQSWQETPRKPQAKRSPDNS